MIMATVFSLTFFHVHAIKNAVDFDSVDQSKAASSCGSFTIRVCLDVASASDGVEWSFKAPEGFVVGSPTDKQRSTTLHDNEVRIRCAQGTLFLQDKRVIGKQLKISPVCGHTTFAKNEYTGGFVVALRDDKVYLINVDVDIEDYIAGVVCAESWPGWPLEVNKAFAIACRSYLMAQVLNARTKTSKRDKPLLYDLRSTNIHQTYRGKSDSQHVWQAVDQTRGVVLAHNKKPIMAMYDACCGGVVPAHCDHFDFTQTPYLARAYACSSCKDSKVFSWAITYEKAALEELLSRFKKKKVVVSDIKITKKDAGGLVREVRVKTGKYTHATFSGKDLYGILKNLKSFCFSIINKGTHIIFSGRGYGHHVGLCQWGARQMVRDGCDYKKILAFYYPGTTFMRLEAMK